MNNVNVDEPRIREELAAAAGAPIDGEFIGREQPGAGAAAEQSQADQPGGAQARDWTMLSRLVVVAIDRLVCPNWNLQAEEKTVLAGATQEVFGAWFPEVKLHPKVESLLAFATVFLGIAASRIDWEKGEMTPMRAPPPEKPQDETEQGVGLDADRAAS